MKTLNVMAAALLTSTVVLSTPAFAADSSVVKTRAQVTAELAQARASGELGRMNSEDSANFLAAKSFSPKTRAQVLAELKNARADGELDRLNSEDKAVALRDTPVRGDAGQARGE